MSSEIIQEEEVMDKSMMKVLVSPTLRELVRAANEAGVSREGVVSIMRDGGQFTLVYYG